MAFDFFFGGGLIFGWERFRIQSLQDIIEEFFIRSYLCAFFFGGVKSVHCFFF